MLVVLFGAAAWRLSSGPVSLSFLRDQIESALARRFAPYAVDLKDVVLAWAGWDRVLDVRAVNVVVTGPDGDVVASVPEVSLGLSGRALLKGEFQPVSIELIGPAIELVRGADGKFIFELGTEIGAKEAPIEALLAELNAGAATEEGPAPLEQLSVLDAHLVIDDQLNELTWEAHGIDINLYHTPSGVRGDLALKIAFANVTTQVAADILYDRTAPLLNVDFRITDALPERLAAISPALSDIAALKMPLSGELDTFFDPQFTLNRVEFDLAGGPGEIVLPGLFDREMSVHLLQLRGAAFDRFATVRLDDLYADFGGPSLALSGLFHRGEGGEEADGSRQQGTIEIKDMPFDEIERYWPTTFAPRARSWVTANLSEGTVERLRADFDLAAADLALDRPPNDIVKGEMTLENVTVNYLDTLPKLHGVSATASFDANDFWFDIGGGRLLDNIRVESGKLVLSDIWQSEQLVLDTRIQGPTREILAVLDVPRLGYPGRYGMDPKQIGGEATADLHFAFPMLMSLELKDVKIAANADFTGFGWPDALEGYDVSGGRLALSLDNAGMDIQGPADVNGVPVNLAWRENFADGATFYSRLAVNAALDDAGLAAWRLPAAPFLTGRFDGRLIYIDFDRRRRQVIVDLDGTHGVFAPPGLLWTKPAGEEGLLSLTINLEGPDTPPVLSSATLAADGFLAEGHGVLEPGFAGLRELDVTTLRFGGNDLQVRWRPEAGNADGHDVAITGKSLDLVPYIERFAEESEEPTPDLALSVNVGRLVTRDDGSGIADARAVLRFEGDSMREAGLDGTLAGGQPVQLRLAPAEGNTRHLRVLSEDAGALLKAFDLFDNAVGGKFVLEASLDDNVPNHPMKGLVTIKDYNVVKAPTLALILSYGSFLGLLDLLQGEGIWFARLELPFHIESDVMTIADARTSGPSLGINVDGTVNLKTDESDLKGTIVPAYAVNSLLGNIPIVGDILVGGEGQGIIAANFHVTGPVDDPKVSVNPASMLTPGFLRQLFGVFESAPPDKGQDKEKEGAPSPESKAGPAEPAAPETKTAP